jgi:hypothetical protein
VGERKDITSRTKVILLPSSSPKKSVKFILTGNYQNYINFSIKTNWIGEHGKVKKKIPQLL